MTFAAVTLLSLSSWGLECLACGTPCAAQAWSALRPGRYPPRRPGRNLGFGRGSARVPRARSRWSVASRGYVRFRLTALRITPCVARAWHDELGSSSDTGVPRITSSRRLLVSFARCTDRSPVTGAVGVAVHRVRRPRLPEIPYREEAAVTLKPVTVQGRTRGVCSAPHSAEKRAG